MYTAVTYAAAYGIADLTNVHLICLKYTYSILVNTI